VRPWYRRADIVTIKPSVVVIEQIEPVEAHMAKKSSEAVYRIVDVVGVSEKSWEDAARNAVETASGSLRDLRIAEVTKMDIRLEDGKIVAFRTRVALSFKYEG
jgi:flavin-binding protein dodecin